MSAETADGILVSGAPRPELQPYVDARGEEIAVGVERAAAFLQAASRDAPGIQQLFMSGGGARVHGLKEALGNRLGLPVEIANPLQRLQVAEGVFDMMDVDEISPLLMLGVGLALRT